MPRVVAPRRRHPWRQARPCGERLRWAQPERSRRGQGVPGAPQEVAGPQQERLVGTAPLPLPRLRHASPPRRGSMSYRSPHPASRAPAQDRCSCSRYLHRMATRVARLTTRSRRAAGSIRPRVNCSRLLRRVARSAVHVSILPASAAPDRFDRSRSALVRARRSRIEGASRPTIAAVNVARVRCSRSETRARRLTTTIAPAPTTAATATSRVGIASRSAVSGRTSARL